MDALVQTGRIEPEYRKLVISGDARKNMPLYFVVRCGVGRVKSGATGARTRPARRTRRSALPARRSSRVKVGRRRLGREKG